MSCKSIPFVFLVNIRRYQEEYNADKLLRSVTPPISLHSLINLQTQDIAQAAVQAVKSATFFETPGNPEISEAITVDIRPIWPGRPELNYKAEFAEKRDLGSSSSNCSTTQLLTAKS